MLVTNHQGNREKPSGAVFVYEIPSDLSSSWTRHTLASSFDVLQKGFKQAAPGGAVAFQPSSKQKSKPLIALAGDGSQKAYLLKPKSEDPKNWDYELTLLHDCKCTVGGLAVGDLKGTYSFMSQSEG